MSRRRGGTASVIFYVLFVVVFSLVVLQRVLPWEFNSAGNSNSYTTAANAENSKTGNLRGNSCAAEQVASNNHGQAPSILRSSDPPILAADSSPSIYLLPTLPLDAQ